jgi:hypothetical protein
MKTLKKTLNKENIKTLYSLKLLASVYRYQERWTEAETIKVQMMKTIQKILGNEHPDTLTSIANLASTYSKQGRWTETKKI